MITTAAANIAHALRTGPVSLTGKKLWYGYNIVTASTTLVATNYTSDGQYSTNTATVTTAIDQASVTKDPNANVSHHNVLHKRFDPVYYSFKEQFDTLIGTHDPDCSTVKEVEGKLIAKHGFVRIVLSRPV